MRLDSEEGSGFESDVSSEKLKEFWDTAAVVNIAYFHSVTCSHICTYAHQFVI